MKPSTRRLLPLLSLLLPLCLAQQKVHAQTQATDVATSGSHSCAALTSGEVKCWGSNAAGQLGDGTTTLRTTAAQVKGLETEKVIQIGAGANFTCALTATAKVYCWGDNKRGQLGAGSTLQLSMKPLPVLLQTGSAKTLSVGQSHACIIDNYGNVYCWGDDSMWQLNLRGGSNKFSNYPLFIVGEGDFIGISAGFNHSCGVTNSGAVKCFGSNSSAQLGFGDTSNHLGTPLAVPGLTGITQASAVSLGSCAVNQISEVYCWGVNSIGLVGLPPGSGQPSHYPPVRMPSVRSDVIAVKGGFSHRCVLTASGKVQCWGSNQYGQLGRGTPNSATHIAADVLPLPEFVTALAAGSHHNCAIISGGGVKCWGRNDYGQIGNGTKADAPSAVAVLNL